MADLTQVDIQTMYKAGQQVMDTSTQVASFERATMSTMDSLMATWGGGSATAFAASMGPFYDQCQQIQDVLKLASEQITESARTYAQHHHMNIDVAHQLAQKAGMDPGRPLQGFPRS